MWPIPTCILLGDLLSLVVTLGKSRLNLKCTMISLCRVGLRLCSIRLQVRVLLWFSVDLSVELGSVGSLLSSVVLVCLLGGSVCRVLCTVPSRAAWRQLQSVFGRVDLKWLRCVSVCSRAVRIRLLALRVLCRCGGRCLRV